MAGDSEGAWPVGLDPEDDDSEVSSAERDGRPKRRFSLAPLGKSIASLASNVGESLARTAAAAGELLSDAELRSRSAALLTESAKKAGAGMAKGEHELPTVAWPAYAFNCPCPVWLSECWAGSQFDSSAPLRPSRPHA